MIVAWLTIAATSWNRISPPKAYINPGYQEARSPLRMLSVNTRVKTGERMPAKPASRPVIRTIRRAERFFLIAENTILVSVFGFPSATKPFPGCASRHVPS